MSPVRIIIYYNYYYNFMALLHVYLAINVSISFLDVMETHVDNNKSDESQFRYNYLQKNGVFSKLNYNFWPS